MRVCVCACVWILYILHFAAAAGSKQGPLDDSSTIHMYLVYGAGASILPIIHRIITPELEFRDPIRQSIPKDLENPQDPKTMRSLYLPSIFSQSAVAG